ncbi:MAG TPA: hypothetical protein VFM51_08360 [Solirubrobacterales bacterium]|nr:hypothetical protein [Solirubrobacterales bacterium]
MTRILKALGLAVATAAALVALMAPAAQAATGVLTAEAYPAMLTAPKPGAGVTFDIGEGPLKTVQCGPSKLDGTITEPTDPVTFTPTYNAGCVAEPGAMPVTITTNGCDYSFGFTKPATTGWGQTTGAMQAWLNCPVGTQMEIHIYENAAMHAAGISLCTYDIGPQGPVAAGVYHNRPMAVPPDVDMTVNARFTAKSTIGPEFVCGGEGLLQHLPITLTGTYTLRAFTDVGGVEGAQIGVDVG